MTTENKTLTNAYQTIATGPVFITLEEGLSVKIHIGTILPAVDVPFHELKNENSPLSYTGVETVYARRNNERTQDTVTVIAYTTV